MNKAPMNKAWAALGLMLALPGMAQAQTVTHAPFDPAVEPKVRDFVHSVAQTFGAFYPAAQFRNVRAVYFQSGAVIVCGEMEKVSDTGQSAGWRYFSNSGPLIFESDKLETLCDQRSYEVPAFSDDHEYGPEFTLAASR